MTATARWALPLIATNQAQKDVTHNEALVLVDGLSHLTVESLDLAAPPLSPLAGQAWIVAAAGSGAWAGHDGAVALYTDGGWRFVTPRQGMSAWVVDRGLGARFSAGVWLSGIVAAEAVQVAGVQVVGSQQAAIADPAAGAVIDVEARTAIAALLAAMRAHGLIAP